MKWRQCSTSSSNEHLYCLDGFVYNYTNRPATLLSSSAMKQCLFITEAFCHSYNRHILKSTFLSFKKYYRCTYSNKLRWTVTDRNNPPIPVINIHTKQMRIISHYRESILDTSVYQMNKTQISHFFAVYWIQGVNTGNVRFTVENDKRKHTSRF